MKIKQPFKTERFADALVSALKQDKNITASKEKTEAGDFLVSYETVAFKNESVANELSPENVYSMVNEAVNYVMSEVQYYNKFVMAEIDAMWSWAGSHSKGHLPNVQGAEQMTRAVKGLGLDKEFEVRKKVITASNTWVAKNGNPIDSIQADVSN